MGQRMRTTKSKKNNQPWSNPKPHFKLPGTVRRLGTRLLDQQMWCWGRDIRCKAGNLLLAYGFERYRSAGEHQVSSYTLNPTPDSQLVLWGAGLFYGRSQWGGLFLKRYEFRPKFTPSTRLAAHPGQTVAMPSARLPQTADEIAQTNWLLLEALACLSRYEAWVIETKGSDYRRQVLNQWHRKPVTPPDGGAAAWQDLCVAVGQTIDFETSKQLSGFQNLTGLK